MKIAQIVPSLKPTGPVIVSLDLTKLFRTNGHQVDLFHLDDSEDAVSEPSTKISMLSKLNWNQYDIVHSHGLRPDLFVRKNNKRMRATVSTIHNYAKQDLTHEYNKIIAEIFEPVWNWACAKHDCNVMLCEDMKNYYSRFWRNKNLKVIPNTRVIDVKHNRNNIDEIKSFSKKKKVIGSLATVNTRKGLDQILQFIKIEPEWVYVHVGGGDLNPLKQLASQLNISGRCLFIGHKDKGWEYVQAFDVFAVPSLSEGFGLSLIEAVQYGVPVVASNINVFKELYAENEVSFFDLNDLVSLQKAIINADLLKKDFIKNALEKFKKAYAPEIVFNKYLNVYKAILKTN